MWLALTRAKHICNQYFLERIFKNKNFRARAGYFLPTVGRYDAAEERNGWRLRLKNLNPRTG